MLNNFVRSHNDYVVEIRHELKLPNPKAYYTCISQIVALGIAEDEASAKAE